MSTSTGFLYLTHNLQRHFFPIYLICKSTCFKTNLGQVKKFARVEDYEPKITLYICSNIV